MLHMLKTTFAAASFLLAAGPLNAQSFPIQGVASFEILPGYRTDRGTQMAAARIRLKDGWKTYWRAPGGNGIPPQFRWTGSKNIKAVAFHWPEPKIFFRNGLRTIGYKHELVLPIEFQPKDRASDMTVAGQIDFGVCSDVCIPASATFSVRLPRSSPSHQSTIQKALRARPLSANKGGVASASCKITAIKDGFRIAASIVMTKRPVADILTVIEFANPEVWVESGATTVAGNTILTTADLFPFTDQPFVLERSRLNLTLLGGKKAVEIRGCPS